MLSISLMGWPKFTLNGEAVDGFISDKAVATLVYLILTGDVCSRVQLGALLWHDVPEKRVKANLRNVIHNLQQLVGEYLEVSRKEIAFRPKSNTHIDIIQLNSAETADQLRPLLAEINGDLLEGFHLTHSTETFEQWLLSKREQARAKRIDALQTVATHDRLQGATQSALDALQTLAQLEPYRESIQHDLMLLWARSGEFSQALASYQTYRQRLLDEIGTEPLAETLALVERIEAAVQRPRHNLPVDGKPFFGRETTLRQLQTLLPTSRLITLMGAGGMGKTRLALTAARQFHTHFLDGAAWVRLADVAQPAQLADAIYTALVQAQMLRPSQSGKTLAYLCEQLQARELLLVLDNFEHLKAATSTLQRLLGAAPALTILITSRERLGMSNEQVVELHGLEYVQQVEQTPAVSLFAESARRINRRFTLTPSNQAAVAQICALVEGMPLALELAAVWVRMQSCEQIAQQLRASLDAFTGRSRSRPQRQRSIRAVFDYSWQQLNTNEQQLMGRLTVFHGGFTATAAEQIAAATQATLHSLVDKSLVQRIDVGDGKRRYRQHALLRQFSAETTPYPPSLRNTHATYFLAQLRERVSVNAPLTYTTENDNIQSAWLHAAQKVAFRPDAVAVLPQLTHLLRSQGLREAGKLLVENALKPIANGPFHLTLYREWLRFCNELGENQAVLDAIGENDVDDPLVAIEQVCALQALGDNDSAETAITAALNLPNEQQTAQTSALLAHYSALVAMGRSNYTDAVPFFQTAADYFETNDSSRLRVKNLTSLSFAYLMSSQYPKARVVIQQAVDLSRQKNDLLMAAEAGISLTHIYLADSNLVEAGRIYRQAIRDLEAAGAHGRVVSARRMMGVLHFTQQEHAAAHRVYTRALYDAEQSGDRMAIGWAQYSMGQSFDLLGCYDEALAYFDQAYTTMLDVGDKRGQSVTLQFKSIATRHLGDSDKAVKQCQDALALVEAIQNIPNQTNCLFFMGLAYQQLGQLELASRRIEEAIERYQPFANGEPQLEMELALAVLEYQLGDTTRTKKTLKRFLPTLQQCILKTPYEPMQVYLNALSLLQALDAPEYMPLLQTAHQYLLKQANELSDLRLRKSFLNNVEAHRQLITLVNAAETAG
ncbi:MAG: tetratricopeptide repeat protein [Candidatus Promineifilaceae bacterium]